MSYRGRTREGQGAAWPPPRFRKRSPRSSTRSSDFALGPYLFVLAVAIIDFFVIGPAQFVNGLTIGAIYALVAIGYTMVYGIIELINFAHGDVFMVGAFTSMYVLTNVLGQDGPIDEPAVLAVVLFVDFAVTMLLLGILGTAIERFAYRPLRHAPRLAPLITAIGVSFILQNIIQILFGPSPVNTPQLISPTAHVNILGLEVGVVNIFTIVVAVSLMIAPPTVRQSDTHRSGDALDGDGPRCGRSSWASTSTGRSRSRSSSDRPWPEPPAWSRGSTSGTSSSRWGSRRA